MKNYIYILSFIFICFTSCDKIEKPIPELPGAIDWNLYPGDSLDYLAYYNFNDPESNWISNTNTKRNILLEYYTGHICTNCPDAAIIGKQLEDNNSYNLTMVSIHAGPGGPAGGPGFFQSTYPLAPEPEFDTDFTTQAGNDYITEMPGIQANPKGTINRNKTSSDNTVWHGVGDWEIEVIQENNQNLLANIQVQTNYFPSTNGLFIHTESEFNSNLTDTSLSGNYHLVIYLIRKSIIAPQKMPDGSTNYYYNHHNVLSDNINGKWGTPIVSGGISNETKFYNDFSFELVDPSIDSTFKIENLSLISYLFERSSFKIIQVTKTDLEP
jgi:hypothetical protein